MTRSTEASRPASPFDSANAFVSAVSWRRSQCKAFRSSRTGYLTEIQENQGHVLSQEFANLLLFTVTSVHQFASWTNLEPGGRRFRSCFFREPASSVLSGEHPYSGKEQNALYSPLQKDKVLFLTQEEDLPNELADRLGVGPDKIKARVTQHRETSSMLGQRGCRLSIAQPKILQMQVNANTETAGVPVTNPVWHRIGDGMQRLVLVSSLLI